MRVRRSVDVKPEPKRRLKVAAALRNVSIKTRMEQALKHELAAEPPENVATDHAWLKSDPSHLRAYEPYHWQDGELDEGEPLTVEHARGC